MKVLGLSGGIDSALAACVAAAPRGPVNMIGVCMPPEDASQDSLVGILRLHVEECRRLPITNRWRG